MNRFFLTLFVAAAVLMMLFGCSTTSNDSYNTSRQDAVPVNELGARGAKFAGQAQQFLQANMAINPCPQGTVKKTGSGSVNSGAGDQNGKVTYSITANAVAQSECDFSANNKAEQQPAAAQAPKAYLAPPTGLVATQPGVDSPKAAPAEKPAVKK